MSMVLLGVVIVALAAAVLVAIFMVLWRARTSPRQSLVAVASAVTLASWALVTAQLARNGFYRPPDLYSPPPVGIALGLVLGVLALCLLLSPSLRGLLTNQRHLILLNLWRLVGVVFLMLMANRQMPALWALPAGIGDVIVGATAPWIARHVDTPDGKRRAIMFNLLGMADLVVAVGLGVMTSPGPAHVFHTSPTSELATEFPLALVPTFLVPLAFVLHVTSLWQLLSGAWVTRPASSSGARNRRRAQPPDQRVVLITGASSGVGQSTARLLSQRGYRVFGTSRLTSAIEPTPVEMLSLDVRSDGSVRACVDAVLNRSGHIDVLINNAGYELAGALEELSLEEARAQFETNFFGVIRMVDAVLPLMRRDNRGHIINVSSLAGLSAIPFLGVYSASKFALEGYTEALRHEVKPFNIHVSLTEAGFLRTSMMDHRQLGVTSLVEYGPWRQRALNAVRAHEEKGPGPEVVAEALLGIVSSRTPRLRYLIGKQAKTVARLRRFLPAGAYESGVRRTFAI
jgi:NAD(P)-dependent dehydrogenase (short-subunit alcohol dehydrogenase family)